MHVALGKRREHAVVAGRVNVEEGLFAAYRGGGEHSLGRLRVGGRGRAVHAGKYHVPHPAVPAAERAVARVPLLLGAGADFGRDEEVAHEAARSIAAVGVGELEPAVDLEPAQGGGLRHAPLQGVGRRVLERVRRRVDGHVLKRAPEDVGLVGSGPGRRVVNGDAEVGREEAVDGDAAGQEAEAGDLLVIADGCLDIVCAGLEQDRVAVLAELVFLGDGGELVLDRRRRDGRVEDQDVRAERIGLSKERGGGEQGRKRGPDAGCKHGDGCP